MALSPVPAGLVLPGNIVADFGWEGTTVGQDAYYNPSGTDGPRGNGNPRWAGYAGGPVGPGRTVIAGPPNTRNSDRSLYMEVRDGDLLAGSNERVQIQASTIREYDGDEAWYSFSSFLNNNLLASGSAISFALFMQFHAAANGSPPVSLVMDGGQMGLKIHRYVTPESDTNYSVHFPWRKPLANYCGRWVDWRMRIKWSSSDDIGFLEMWVDGVKQTFDFPGGLGATDPSGRNWGRGTQRLRIRTNRFGKRNYLTFGLYRNAGTSGTWSAYFDNVRISDGAGYVEGTDPGAGSGGGTPPPDPDPVVTVPAEDTAATRMGVSSAYTGTWVEARADRTRGSTFELAEGTVSKRTNKIKCYMDGNGSGVAASQKCKAHINNATTGALLATSQEVTITKGRAAGWVEFDFSSYLQLTEGTRYDLCVHSGDGDRVARFTNSPAGGSKYGDDEYDDGPPSTFGLLTAAAGVDIYAVIGDVPASTSAEIGGLSQMSMTHTGRAAALAPDYAITNVAYFRDGPLRFYQEGTLREVLPNGQPGAAVRWDGSKFVYA